MIPLRATARLQLHAGFDFDAARAQVGYFAALGISHLYLSPIATATPGSGHGYDGTDPCTINPELGGEAAFLRLASAAREAGMGLLLDIVPNHLAANPHNPWWADVLMHGRRSRHADWFDIDWNAPGCGSRLWLPVLDRPLHDALRAGVLQVEAGGERPCLRHHDLRLPLSPSTHPLEAAQWPAWAEACNGSADRLLALLQGQHYRLAWWRSGNDQVNYRRFFDITGLAALRCERADVFEAVHALPLRLVREGWVDGLRVDHVDGLSDPGAYVRRLRAALDAAGAARGLGAGVLSLHVEKILAEDEVLPADWPCDGTTGYDFMDQAGAWLHDPRAVRPLSRQWQSVSGDRRSFEALQQQARTELLRGSLQSDFCRLQRVLLGSEGNRHETADLTVQMWGRASMALLQHYPVYRPYTLETTAERQALVQAETAAAAQLGHADRAALQQIGQALRDEGDAVAALRVRFGQLSAPLNAKAVEDTGFYRYGRWLARNEVGSAPERMALNARDLLSRAAARARRHPRAMLALATHDHKRGADSRARLAAVTARMPQWQAAVRAWETGCAEAGAPMPLPAAQRYMVWQTLVGSWPMHGAPAAGFAARLGQWLRKALREGKQLSSWTDPDEGLEQRAEDWLRDLLEGPALAAVRTAVAAFVAEVGAAGARNGLAQLALQHCLPGIPDLYQGGEGWDLSLVDPDNRRPVDFAQRQQWLQRGGGWAQAVQDWHDGQPKALLLHRLLQCRQAHPQLFAHGRLRPLATPARSGWLCFRRDHAGQSLLVLVARATAPAWPSDGLRLAADAHDEDNTATLTGLPVGPLRNVVDGRTFTCDGTARAAQLLDGGPLAVWITEGE